MMLYGRLYTWEVALEACPSGWHLPSDDEWKQLEMAIGMSQSEADDTGWRGTNEGTKLKATSGWNSNNSNENGTDDFDFSALPGGYRNYGDYFDFVGGLGLWWSASEHNSDIALCRYISFGNGEVLRGGSNKEDGFSVRCMRD